MANPLPEPHYSPRTLAECWGFSEKTIIRWFEDLPGVLKSSDESRNGKRTRIVLRIPKNIAEKVYAEKTKGRCADPNCSKRPGHGAMLRSQQRSEHAPT